MGRLQRADSQRVGRHEEFGRPVGRRDDGRAFLEGVRRLSFVGASRHRRHGVRGARDRARGARRDGGGRAGDGRVSRIAFALIVALLLAACHRQADIVRSAPRQRPDEVNFTLVESPSLQFLPRQQEAQEWRLEEDPIVVPGDRLTSYLDQDGVRFAHYGALDLAAGKYAPVSGDGFATVEIFRFPDFVKAFGAYSMRKEGSIKLLSLANESFATAHSTHI